MINKEKIIDLVNERIEELNNGSYLVDVNISSNNSIVVEMDNMNNSVSINDCVSVSRNVEHNLDRDQEDFDLKVTSPGLDQPFKVINQYYKNIGRKVKIVHLEHGSSEGLLTNVTDQSITIEWEEKERLDGKKKKIKVKKEKTINYKEIKETKLILSFK